MNLDVKLAEKPDIFDVQLSGCREMGIDFGQIHQISGVDVPIYTGDYSVVPGVEEKVLKTKGKMMKGNLIVEKIPYFDVGNNAGGSTVYIGGEE